MNFAKGDTVVHPLHGAGVIENIIKNDVSGSDREYYVLKALIGGIQVMVPVKSSLDIGLRPTLTAIEAEALFESVCDMETSDDDKWTKRYKLNMEKIRSGRPEELMSVIKSLLEREDSRGLSSGERRLLLSAKRILISEMKYSTDSSYEEVEHRINRLVLLK